MPHDVQIIRKRAAESGWRGVLLLFCLLLSVTAEAGVPALTSQQVTDITPRSFTLIGTASEPASVALSLFAADCATPATGAIPLLKQSGASGNFRLTVTGLTAGSTYCYQLAATSTSTAELTTSAPASVTTAGVVARTVSTASGTLPTGNDTLLLPAPHLAAGETGDAVVSTLELVDGSALSPLSLFHSGDASGDYLDLNNLFAAATGRTLDVVGGERVRISDNHGVAGCVVQRYRTIPADGGGTAARPFTRANMADIDASGGVNILDVLRVVGGKGGTTGDPCFNSDLDQNGDGTIDGADLAAIKGGFNGRP